MIIFEAIRDDHEAQRTLIDLLLETEGTSDGRQELFDRLKLELDAHAAAEERYFHVPLMEIDVTQEHALHSVADAFDVSSVPQMVTEATRPTAPRH